MATQWTVSDSPTPVDQSGGWAVSDSPDHPEKTPGSLRQKALGLIQKGRENLEHNTQDLKPTGGFFHDNVLGTVVHSVNRLAQNIGGVGLNVARDVTDTGENVLARRLKEGEEAGEKSIFNPNRATPATNADVAEQMANGIPLLPGVGSQVRQYANSEHPVGDILGDAAQIALLHGVSRTTPAMPRPTPGALRRTAQAVVIGRRAVPEMVQEAIKNNAAEMERATTANTANELAHGEAARKAEQANLDIAAEHRRKVARLKTEDTTTLDKWNKSVADHKADAAAAQAAHDEAVAAVAEKNRLAAKEHEGVVVQALQERRAAEQTAGRREQAEADLQRKTDAYFAKEDATDARVKADVNQTWKPWHAKAKGAMTDVDPLVDVLERVGKDNPEAVKLMRKMAPPKDFVPPESQFVKDRQGIIDDQDYIGGPGMPYDQLNPLQKQAIDAKVRAAGFEPEPVDFNPVRGVPMSLEEIHRAQSILGSDIANGKYEGVVKGEMIQIHKALQAAEYRGSKAVGALPDLEAGKKATKEHQEAFGKERRVQRTGKTERKGDANSEAVDDLAKQKRLAAVAKHDPSLVEDYKAVQAARKHLQSFSDPEQLRKGLSSAQPPDRPTETPLPKPPKTKPEPEDPLLHGRQGVPDLRQPPPPKPPVEPKIVRPGPEEARQARLGALNEQIKWVQHRGKWVASGAAFSGVLYGILNRNVSAIAEAVAGAAASIVGTQRITNFLERPGVQEYLLHPDPSDVKYFERMPPDQRAVVAEGFRPVVEEAQSKGLKVSPVLLTLIGAQLVQQPKTAEEAKKKVKELRSGR